MRNTEWGIMQEARIHPGITVSRIVSAFYKTTKQPEKKCGTMIRYARRLVRYGLLAVQNDERGEPCYSPTPLGWVVEKDFEFATAKRSAVQEHKEETPDRTPDQIKGVFPRLAQ